MEMYHSALALWYDFCMFKALMVERGRVELKYSKKEKKWRAEVGGTEEDNRFLLPDLYDTPGEALDASREWARQRKMMVWARDTSFQVLGEPV